MKKVLWLLAGLAAAVVIIPFAVANRHTVPLTVDPFARLQSGLAVDVPLSLLMFVMFMLGLIAGGLAAWLGQGKWRRTARRKTREAYQWRSEADRLARERDEGVVKQALGSTATRLAHSR